MGTNMKNMINNSVMTGCKVMAIFQGLGQLNTKRVRGFLCSFAACLLILNLVTQGFAQTQYYVDDEIELQNAMNAAPLSKEIHFERSIGVQNPQVYQLAPNSETSLYLHGYTFLGNGYLEFNVGGPANAATVDIFGSTLGFNGGLKLHDKLTLNYHGVYSSTTNDLLGELATDDVTVNVLTPGSGWNVYGFDMSIGYAGKATFNIANANWGESKNVFIGDLAGSTGVMNMYHQGTNWRNDDDFIVGRTGNGTLNLGRNGNDTGNEENPIYFGSIIRTGNFGVGANAGSTGLANICGNGTILDIFGTNTGVTAGTGGNATMNVYKRAEVYLHYNDVLSGPDPTVAGSRADAFLTLGTGTSTFDDAYFKMDRGTIVGANNDMTFQNAAMFEGSAYGYIRDDANLPTKLTNFGPVGSITLSSLNIDQGAMFSPGFGSRYLYDRQQPLDFTSQDEQVMMYFLAKNADPFDDNGDIYVNEHNYPLPVGRYGQMDITGDFNLKQDGVAFFDFDIQGAQNHPDFTEEHQDYVSVTGTATMDGHIHFRPMTGYYQDAVDIFFMDAGGYAGDPNAQMTLWPKRWFENPVITDGHLEMDRSTSPFYDSALTRNEFSVGVALDWIYNDRQAMNVNNDMLTQENDIWFPVLDWVWPMNDYDFRMAMRQLSGEVRAASFYMPMRSPWRYGFDRVNWRKRDNHVFFGQQNVFTPKVSKSALWASPFYNYQQMDDDNNTSEGHISRVSAMVGYDYALSQSSALGFLFSYSQPKLEQKGSRVIADDFLFGLHYSTRICDLFEMKAWGSYGTQHYKQTRTLGVNGGETLRAGYSGDSWNGSIELTKPFYFGDAALRPLLAVDASYVSQTSAEEEGYFPVALRFCGSDWEQYFARTGVRFDYGKSCLNLTGALTYSYQFAGDVAPHATNQFLIGGPEFTIEGSHLDRSFVGVELGTQMYLNKIRTRSLSVQYNGEYGRRSNNQMASLTYQVNF